MINRNLLSTFFTSKPNSVGCLILPYSTQTEIGQLARTEKNIRLLSQLTAETNFLKQMQEFALHKNIADKFVEQTTVTNYVSYNWGEMEVTVSDPSTTEKIHFPKPEQINQVIGNTSVTVTNRLNQLISLLDLPLLIFLQNFENRWIDSDGISSLRYNYSNNIPDEFEPISILLSMPELRLRLNITHKHCLDKISNSLTRYVCDLIDCVDTFSCYDDVQREKEKNIEEIEFFIRNGANPNLKYRRIKKDSITNPLCSALKHNMESTVKLLIDKRADMSLKINFNETETALMYFINSCIINTNILKMILAASGESVNIYGNNGETPLTKLIDESCRSWEKWRQEWHIKMLKLLIQHPNIDFNRPRLTYNDEKNCILLHHH